MKSFQTRQSAIASQFLLDPDVAFFNHGSFGACSRPVFEVYQNWQRQLEAQPVDFIHRQLPDLLADARQKAAAFVGVNSAIDSNGDLNGGSGEHVVFVPNATYGINAVAHSLKLEPGDEVLASDHEYGAVNNTWRFLCERSGAKYINQTIPLPFESPEAVVDLLWKGVTERTKVITFSHITSPTALILPAELICKRANEEGIITVIDGAHALGQIDLDFSEMQPTFYTGNAHKWLCAPKGAAILYAAPGFDEVLEPLVVSHGWTHGDSGSKLIDYFSWTGTMDPSAYLSVPAAIEFQQEHNWSEVREACHAMALDARDRIQAITGLPQVCSSDHRWFEQMFTARIPDVDRIELRNRLWTDHKIEVTFTGYHDEPLIRVSVQAYNTPEDVDRLIAALEASL